MSGDETLCDPSLTLPHNLVCFVAVVGLLCHDSPSFSHTRDFVMPLALTFALFVFWIFLAYRAFTRGDMAMAGMYLLIGIALTVYRYTVTQKAKARSNS